MTLKLEIVYEMRFCLSRESCTADGLPAFIQWHAIIHHFTSHERTSWDIFSQKILVLCNFLMMHYLVNNLFRRLVYWRLKDC